MTTEASAPPAPRALHLRGGKIHQVLPYETTVEGVPTEDVGAGLLMPALVDSHVHINEPGRTLWEGFATATRAAAAGGVGTVVDMPLNSIPPTTTVENLQAKVRAADGNLWVDVGLWGGAIPGNALELRRMLDAGALGFKCFMVPSGVDEFPHVEPPDLERALGALAETGAPLLVHAELQGPLDAALKALGAAPDPRRYETYLRSRPTEAEDQAVALLLGLCRRTRARVHVVHLASSGALGLLARARDEGLPFTAETTPHYLSLSAETVPDGDTAYKCAPPIREERHRERLWEALGSGLLGQVVTDHSPCTPELKLPERGDFLAAWGGIASLQFGLPVVWTEARARGHDPSALLRWMAEAPAALATLAHRKGRLLPGYDADLVLWDPEARFTLTPDLIEHRHKVTPYLGRSLYGVVHKTWVGGRCVYTRSGGPRFAPVPTGRWLARGAS